MPSAREQMVTSAILSAADVGVSLSVMAARHTGFHVAHLLENGTLRDPWRPLLDLWRLGVWPMGEMGDGAFAVYVPAAQS